jgi:hypothetical protein
MFHWQIRGTMCSQRRPNELGASGNIRKSSSEVWNKLWSQTTGKNPVNLVLLPVGEMLKTALLTNDDRRRHPADGFIKNTCAPAYGARLETFPSRIPTLLDNRDQILRAGEM